MKFSVLNLLMILTAIAFAIGLYSSNRARAKLEAERETLLAENKALRTELGCLTINDPEKLHAINVRTEEARKWSYRVLLPEGRNYYFACQINALPLASAPPPVAKPPSPTTIRTLRTNSVAIGRSHGEYIVTLSIDLESGDWKYRMSVRKAGEAGDGVTGGSSINDVDGKWPEVRESVATGGVYNQREISLENSPLVLLDHRAMNDGVTVSNNSNQGCMLWVGAAN